ncbi:hypothetical protein DB811_18180 [Xanthomonas perforans]|uniref:Uncharacterized protein n=1 Tax=Xanthomonas perforans TaxID=442694 RepID=A0AAQ0YT77_XANPE|nr:hypothetical protein BJD13_06745 [Xanthomonas perforans]AQS75358.1 hypothetical protein XPE_02690 [Xanthomonas perforans 91-118]RXD32885.1 hypothetical protein DB854_23935 [Xanthomonas perforans]RXD40434.1 hypothetical protein DB761_18710 [Xanthomonas perforans]RXD48494.1 hypothetical protein DB768_11670 [Xanthomonas perforans]
MDGAIDMATPSWNNPRTAANGDGMSGGSKPLIAGGRIPLAGVVLAALPTQASRRLVPAGCRHKKPTGLTEVGTAMRGVSTLLGRRLQVHGLVCQYTLAGLARLCAPLG